MNLFTRTLLTTLGGGLLLTGTAQAQPASTTDLPHPYDSMWTSADEIYFYEDNRKQVVDYKRDRVLRICLDDSNHTVPLNITADERELTLYAGDCMRIEAQQVWMEPDRHLPDLAMLKVNIQTFAL